MTIRRSILEPMVMREGNYHVTGADEGEEFWVYIRDKQRELDWWALEVFPDDPSGDLIWHSSQSILFFTAADTVEAAEILLTTPIGPDARLLPVLVHRGVRIAWESLEVPLPGYRVGIVGYVGTAKGSIRPQSVVGVEVTGGPCDEEGIPY